MAPKWGGQLIHGIDLYTGKYCKTDPQTTIYVVVYGVEGQVNDASVNLWDRLYYCDNASVKYEASIDIYRRDITDDCN